MTQQELFNAFFTGMLEHQQHPHEVLGYPASPISCRGMGRLVPGCDDLVAEVEVIYFTVRPSRWEAAFRKLARKRKLTIPKMREPAIMPGIRNQSAGQAAAAVPRARGDRPTETVFVGSAPATQPEAAPSPSFDLGESIKGRLKSKSLYILVGLAIAFNVYLSSENESARVTQLQQVTDARKQLAALSASTESVCMDGWQSPSSGPGTCSWHGGKNSDLKFKVEVLSSIARQDPEKSFREKEGERTNLFLLAVAMAFWLSRGVENILFPKKQSGP